MNRQKTAGIALIWVILGIMITGIVALFIYGIVNRPPNRHIGDGKPWNEKMSQGSTSAKHVFVDYTINFSRSGYQPESDLTTPSSGNL